MSYEVTLIQGFPGPGKYYKYLCVAQNNEIIYGFIASVFLFLYFMWTGELGRGPNYLRMSRLDGIY